MGFRPNIVIKELKGIHFVSQITAVSWLEELIHIGCLPFAWLYNKFLSPLLKTAASFSQPLFITLVMICESKTLKINYFRGLNARRYVHEGIAGLLYKNRIGAEQSLLA